MAVGDSWTSQLIAGLAQYLHDNSIGTYRANGSAYTAAETAIVDRDIPPDPDRVISLAEYAVIEAKGMQDSVIGIQFRLRGTTDPRDCRDLGEAIYELLDSAGHQVWGDIQIVDSWRQSQATLGRDAQNRWEAAHNYYVRAMHPTPNRTE